MPESKENLHSITLSFPYAQSHPTHLYSISTLFGLSPKPVEHARILEIGCLSGGNLIPIAYQFPEATLIGIDKNEKDIALGNKQIADLNLKNIQLKCNNIANLNNTESLLSKFDYIICQGLYTLSATEDRTKLLQFIQENLEPEGIAYISYNTLPGWDIAGNLKDILAWHTHALTREEIKTQQTGAFLKFLLDTIQSDPSPYATAIKNEIYTLARHTSEFVINEYLSENNKAIYFYQFYDAIEKHKLNYISDAFLALSYAENLPNNVKEQLKQLNNIIYTNQYLDLIRNQRYRCSIICHDSQNINRTLTTSGIENYYIQLVGNLENEYNEDPLSEIKCVSPYLTIHSNDRDIKTALSVLAETRFKPLHYKTLCDLIFERGTLKKMADVKTLLDDRINLMHCALAGMINIYSKVNPFEVNVSEKPKGCSLAQYFAEKQGFTTNRRHQVVALDPMAKMVFLLLDGQRTKQDIVELLTKEMQDKDKNINVTDENKNKITDKKIIEEKIKENVEQILHNLAQQALLIA